jgi:hypothetical protein
MPSCQVYIRGSKERIETLGDTVCHLREAVADFLDTAEPRFQQQAQAIRVFGNDSPTELDGESPLTTTIEYTYTAFEVFTSVPTDLFRTVKMNQIHPAVESDPGKNNEFARVSPLFCAALTPSESKDPPFYMQGGRVMIRGASLFYGDKSVQATVAPADEVTETEPMDTLMRIPLDDVKFQNTYDAETEFGILHTSLLNYFLGLAMFPLFPASKKSSRNGSQKKRHFNWRYVIRRGTDLSTLGVSLVFDNASRDHFSLIPNQRNNLYCDKWGVRLSGPQQIHLLRRDPAQPTPPTDTQPEHLPIPYHEHEEAYVTYPLVAQKFELHDFVMRASGLVQSIEPYEDEDRQNIAQAAEILYDRGDGLSNSYELYEALAILSSFAFDVKKVPFYDLVILLNAMTELDDYSDQDDLGDHERSVLSSAVKTIDDFFEMCSQGLMEYA